MTQKLSLAGSLRCIRSKRTIGILFLITFIEGIIAAPGKCHQSFSFPSKNLSLSETMSVVIYYSSACSKCAEYVTELDRALVDANIVDIQEKNPVNDNNARVDLAYLHQKWGVPTSLQGFPIVIIDQKFLFENFVPVDLIIDFLANETDRYEMIVVFHENSKTYKIITTPGEVKEYQLSESDKLWDLIGRQNHIVSEQWFLPLIIVAGLADGINPCAFAIIIFLISFLSISRTRLDIFKIGLIYVGSIYVTYLLIGLGLLNTITILNVSHIMAKIGIAVIIALGILNVKDYFWPEKGPSIKVPETGKNAIISFVHKASVPSAALLGIVAGLCEFPCTGGTYVAILGLLATQATYWQGFIYLIVYNLMFILPLLIILVVASNRKLRQKIKLWQESKKRLMKLVTGLLMVDLGIIIYGLLYGL